MSILKYKYKVHKFVNYIFYIIVFLVGFLIGFSTEKINFNKLISQVLMIDNVSAYNISLSNSNTYDEEFIYNAFVNSHPTFDLNKTPYILCTKESTYSVCFAMNENMFNSLYVKTSSPSLHLLSYNAVTNATYYSITISNDLTYQAGPFKIDSDLPALNSNYVWITIYNKIDPSTATYTNFNPREIDSSMKSLNSVINVLDFSDLSINLEFNENLFKDNSNFKEVCVPNNKDFAISTNNYELNEDETSEYYGSKSYSSYGFIWFPYYINRMESYLYDNSKTDNIWIPEEDETYFDLHPIFHYWFDTKEEIDRVWSLEDPGSFLNSLGYTDKYSYFGWYAHPFVVRYANSGLRQFSIFRFSDDVEFYSTLENGLDYFEKLENARNGNVCFYIRKDFDVTLLNTDEFGDKYGGLTIMGDEKLEILTTQNISNIDNKGLFEKVKLFLNKITKPINFVNDYIFDLYDSMPYILKLFIISVFGLIVIKILIGMVVR